MTQQIRCEAQETDFAWRDDNPMLAAVNKDIMSPVSIGTTDDDLARQIRRGDNKAMKTLYSRHSQRLFTLAVRLTGNRTDAEEVVQDSFVKAWTNIDKFRGESNLGTWLYRIAINLSFDSKKKRRSLAQEVEVPTNPVFSDSLARSRLEKALAELPAGYREVLVMHDVMEMKHLEISEILDIAVGTSKSQLHKARAQMRQMLKTKQSEQESRI